MTQNDPAELFKRARSIAEGALALSVEERDAYITSSCGDDVDLRSQVEQLLSSAMTSDSFLEKTVQGDARGATRRGMPKEVGRYTIRRVIGEGGMGVVYEAVQQSPRRAVALKMIKRGVTSRSALRRFAYEAQTLGRLHHEGIAQIYEADTWNDGSGEVPWFAMEYIAGAKPLTTYANEKGLGTRERLDLFTKVCEAITHGHQKGIIHRDLKPGNILVDVNGQPKIIDYGIARATDSDMAVTTLQTDVGQLLGTVQYMSPEQCAADPDILDTRSDVYSLGVILYELLCEALPYDLESVPVFEAARVIRDQAPNRPSTINRTLRGDVETIVLKALQKDRDQRYQSAHELQQDIQRYLANDPISARPPSLTYQVKVFARRNRALFLSTAAILVVLVAATIVSVVMAINARRSAEDARAAEAEVLLKQERLQASQMYLIHILAIPTPSIAQGRDLDHADLLRIAGEDIDEWFDGMPGYQDDHHALIGYFMVKMGMYDEAEKHLLPALARLEAQHGRDHYKTQFALITIAKMRNGQGHPREADELSAEVEAWVRAKDTWGPMDIEFLIYRLEILDALTRWFDVVTLAQDALDRLQEVSFERAADGFTQEEIELELKGFLGRNLARSSQLQVDNERREKMFKRGFELLEEVIEKAGALAKMGPRHPVTLASRTDWTICNWGSGRTSYSYEDVQEVIDELKLVHGPENPVVLQYQLLVANLLVNKGQIALGEELSRHCMESLESQLDPDHPSIHTAKLALARSLAQQEKHEEAVLLLRDSIELLTERLDPDHLELINVRGLYGVSLMGTGALEEGEPYVEELVTLMENLLGPKHPETLSKRFFMIASHFEHGDKEYAFRSMQAFLNECDQELPIDSGFRIRMHTEHGDMYRDIGQVERATEIYEETYQTVLEHSEPGTQVRRAVFSDLQSAHAANGNLEGALEVNDQILADAQVEDGIHLDAFGWGLGGRLKILEGTGREGEVDRILEDAIEEWWDNALYLNNLAWGIAADWDHEHGRERYPDQMLRAAKRACELNDYEEPYSIDTLARVHFIRGEVDEAIALQERALRMVPIDEAEEYQSALDEYRDFRNENPSPQGDEGGEG